MSVWHKPDVSTLTRTWPGPGSGVGTSSRLRVLVKSWTTAAFMGLSLRCLRKGGSKIELQLGADGLDFGVRLEGLMAHLAAPSGLLVAAEGQGGVEDVV